MREHKKQLHERILRRQSQLQAQLESIEATDHKSTRSEHELAVEDALATLDIHLTTGWDNVGEIEAKLLSNWLEHTELLVDGKATEGRAAAIWRRLDAQWKLHQFGVPATQE